MTKHWRLVDIGLTPYREAWSFQEYVHAEVVAGQASTLILCQHPHVLSLGSQTKDAHLLFSDEHYAALGAEVVRTNRGGDVTYHGPGQLVAYPIFALDHCPNGRDLHKFLRDIEAVIIRALATFGVEAGRNEGKTGVWVGNKKIAAIGLRASRWVSMHGLALNVDPDLSWFERIIPCGLSESVTSLAKTLPSLPTMPSVQVALVDAFSEHFDAHFEPQPELVDQLQRQE